MFSISIKGTSFEKKHLENKSAEIDIDRGREKIKSNIQIFKKNIE